MPLHVGFAYMRSASVISSRVQELCIPELKFPLWILRRKVADPYFFMSELSPFLELYSFAKSIM